MAANVLQTLDDVQRLVRRLQVDGALGGVHPGAHVQVRRRGLMLCGRVVEFQAATEEMPAMWRVELDGGVDWWVTRGNVRACSAVGDSRCICERRPATGELASTGPDGAAAAPLGNTGVTA